MRLQTGANSLSPELCARIAKCTHASDLPRLACTCRSFQIAAEKRIYDQLNLGKPDVAFHIFRTIAATTRLGPYVHELYIYQTDRRWRNATLPLQFWQAAQAALQRMSNLEFLYIHDPAGDNTFILDPAEIKFQIREAQLNMDWDKNVASFLNNQHRMERLQLSYGPDSSGIELGDDALPCLTQFAGPLTVATQLITRRLTHLQIVVDEASPSSLTSLINRISVKAPLYSLSLLELPSGLSIDALQLIAKTCPNLRYVGVLSFPSRQREKFHRCLMNMHHLRVIELQVTKWEPQPVGAIQMVLAAELRIFRPSLVLVAFWVGNSRFHWTREDDTWTFQCHNTRIEPLWKAI